MTDLKLKSTKESDPFPDFAASTDMWRRLEEVAQVTKGRNLATVCKKMLEFMPPDVAARMHPILLKQCQDAIYRAPEIFYLAWEKVEAVLDVHVFSALAGAAERDINKLPQWAQNVANCFMGKL